MTTADPYADEVPASSVDPASATADWDVDELTGTSDDPDDDLVGASEGS